MDYMFSGFKGTELDLSNFVTPILDRTSYMFLSCTNLMRLDIRNMDFTSVGISTAMFGQNANTYVPADCLIIVKDDTAKEWVLAKRSDFTNVKTVAELGV